MNHRNKREPCGLVVCSAQINIETKIDCRAYCGTRPKAKEKGVGDSCLRILVSISVSVSIRIVHENINGVVHTYIYILIYT